MKELIQRTLFLSFAITAITLMGIVLANAQQTTVMPVRIDDVPRVVAIAEAEFGRLYAAGDTKSVSELYAEDAVLMPPNGAAVTGRKDIHAFWQGAWDAGVKKLQVKTTETGGTGGDTSYEVGTYTLYGGTGDIIDDGKYIVIWKRVNKQWYLYRDIWNSNRK